jgi:CRISPR-associated protein Cmr1
VKKNIPQFKPFPDPVKQGVIKQVRTYQLITPLFGGGVNPSEVDTVTPIRGSEIRGHLRFWWRACRGGKYGNNLRALKAEEDKIWGKAHKKGEKAPEYDELVHILVENSAKNPELISPFKIVHAEKNGRPKYQSKPNEESGIPPYAAFPLQPQQQDLDQNPPTEPKKVGDNVTFRLEIAFPENRKKDIESSLWAWETFGGIGARTRRGFGAIRLMEVDGKANKDLPSDNTVSGVNKWILEMLEGFIGVHEDFHKQVPHLTCNPPLKILGPFDTPKKAWNELIKKLARFRQPIDKSKRWPESKQVRAIVQGSKSDEPHPFPKAVLGLPIVFHLSDDHSPSLQHGSKGQERLASPIILRPLVLQNNLAFGVALQLQGNNVRSDDLVLVPDDKNKPPYDATITSILPDEEARAVSVLNGEKDVIQAFMDSLARRDDRNSRDNKRQRNNHRPYNKQKSQSRGGDKRWNRD